MRSKQSSTLKHLHVLDQVQQHITTCDRCSRLREYCRAIGETRRKAYRDQNYWAKPVPGFGDPNARILVLGLAPGAHGANRTGRPFTGDGSGDFMYPVLHELGLASKPAAIHREDGLKLAGSGSARSSVALRPAISPPRRRFATAARI